MRFIALGGAQEIGASSYLLEIEGKNILVDAGIRIMAEKRSEFCPLPNLGLIKNLDLILLTHAHLDHTGCLPLVAAQYPEAKICSTRPTLHLMEILLKDNLRIEETGLEKGHLKAPLYTESMLQRMIARTKTKGFEQWFKPFGSNSLEICFHLAGHIFGAASILIKSREGYVMFSGDISVVNQRTVPGARPPRFFKPDVLIIESTYGARLHTDRKKEERQLALDIAEVIKGQGKVLLPSFALGRAQEILCILKGYQNRGLIPRFWIFVDGLARTICDVYNNLLPLENPKFRRPIFFSQRGQVVKVVEAKRPSILDWQGPYCVISSSGRLYGGPSVTYARHFLGDHKNAIFFSGYQDEESPGQKLIQTKRGDPIVIEGEELKVNCQVSQYDLSAHIDAAQICQLTSQLQPRSVILVHGTSKAMETLEEQLSTYKDLRFDVRKTTSEVAFDPLEKKTEEVKPRLSKPLPSFTIQERENEISLTAIIDLWKKVVTNRPERGYPAWELVEFLFGLGYEISEERLRKALEKYDHFFLKKGKPGQNIYIPRSFSEIS